ncbi:MAG: hypothetical protein ACK50J_17815 [Planctomyces sp.]
MRTTTHTIDLDSASGGRDSASGADCRVDTGCRVEVQTLSFKSTVLSLLIFLGWIACSDLLQAQPDDREFDGSRYRVSVADLLIAEEAADDPAARRLNTSVMRFQHGAIGFTAEERENYLRLWETISEREFAASSDIELSRRSVSAKENLWQTSFYEYEAVRRLAWRNQQIRLYRPAGSENTAGEPAASAVGPNGLPRRDPATSYSVLTDMANYPDDYVGRPVVLYGLYSPSGSIELGTDDLRSGESSAIRLKSGSLMNLQGTEMIAIVDSEAYLSPMDKDRPGTNWRVDPGARIPVLVKGWFVKMWGKQPRIMTKSVRLISEVPYEKLIRLYSSPGNVITDDEKWLYYETLRQMQLTEHAAQERESLAVTRRRIRTLTAGIRDKHAADGALLDAELRKESISRQQFQTARKTLDRQLAVRLAKQGRYLDDPSQFPTYVDVFQNASEWQGSLVSLRGHVRHVVSYPADEKMFPGQMLHELWLFTDDSQHNPAVIVTPTLPADFPTNADVVDRVFVTGCFFKMYVYRADKVHRVAPLILAGRVHWLPTDAQIRTLAKQGALPAQSLIVRNAERRGQSGLSETGVMLIGFLCLLVMMTIWGRMQRDRRERRRLMQLVDSRTDFDQTFAAASALHFPDYDIQSARR